MQTPLSPFLSISFLVRVAQDFERFEQGRLQRAVLPSRFLHNHLEQPALFDGGLLEEQFARPTRQAKHVNGLIDRDWCGLPDVLDLAKETILFAAQGASLFIEKLLRDAPVEFIKIHRPDARFDLVVAGLKLLVGFCTGGLLGTVRIQNRLAQLVQNGRRDNEFLQYAGEFAREDFLPCVRLRAFPAVARTVVVHIPALLQLPFFNSPTSRQPQ